MTTQKTITITTVIDVVAALASNTLSGNMYLLDNNRASGSRDEGTENLKTAVKKGDRLIWTVTALECEAYASIDDILVDPDDCKPQKQTYPDTDIVYWSGTVERDVAMTPYQLVLALGNRGQKMKMSATPCLIGNTGVAP